MNSYMSEDNPRKHLEVDITPIWKVIEVRRDPYLAKIGTYEKIPLTEVKNGAYFDTNLKRTMWYKDDVLHREDGPAIEWSNGSNEWYRDGKLHREDGPAIDDQLGSKFWYQKGQLHREGGPACEWKNGKREWYQNGIRHREDGPAVVHSKFSKEFRTQHDNEWYLNGERFSEAEYQNRVKNIKSEIKTEIDVINAVLKQMNKEDIKNISDVVKAMNAMRKPETIESPKNKM